MAHHKELLDIVRGISGSFNSRNNDFQGYWALGFLYQSTRSHNVTSLKLNILNCEILPNLEKVDSLAIRYHDLLYHLLNAKNISPNWITSATITIYFNEYSERHHEQITYPTGDPYISICKLIDDNGKTYQSIMYGKCRLHDPDKEFKRAM